MKAKNKAGLPVIDKDEDPSMRPSCYQVSSVICVHEASNADSLSPWFRHVGRQFLYYFAVELFPCLDRYLRRRRLIQFDTIRVKHDCTLVMLLQAGKD
jgi:hypothetical protein